MAFNWIDYALLALMLLSAVVGVFRGLVREALSIGVWVVALWCAWNFAPVMAEQLTRWIEEPILRVWAARVIVLIGVLIFGALVTSLIGYLIGRSGLTGTDRLLGMLFGFGRGAILAALLVIGLQFAGFDQAPWWQESKLIPYAAPIADKLRDAAAEGMEKLAA